MSLLTTIAYSLTIYLGIPIYIFGFVGSLLNIRILYVNRMNPCTFLLIYSSLVDCFVLHIGLMPRILAVGFNIDPTLSNLSWCKIRTYGLRISTLISLYTICLTSIDRFFVSCRTVRWRQLSNIQFVHWSTLAMTLLIVLEGLPFFILTDIRRSNTTISCTPMYNLIFATYASFFCIPILFGLLPLSILITMAILISHKLHGRIHLRKAQHTLTSIILFRIVSVLVSCGPYTSYFVYSAIISLIVPVKSAERVAIEVFLLNVVSICLYFTYASPFYVHYWTSPTYRRECLNLFTHLHRTGRQNLVHPAPWIVPILARRNLADV